MLHVFIGYRKSVYTKPIFIKNSTETQQLIYVFIMAAFGCRVHIIRVVDISREIYVCVWCYLCRCLGSFLVLIPFPQTGQQLSPARGRGTASLMSASQMTRWLRSKCIACVSTLRISALCRLVTLISWLRRWNMTARACFTGLPQDQSMIVFWWVLGFVN